jgi:hypothetical protein
MGSTLKRWEIAQTTEKGSVLFRENPILAQRRCPNLKDKLMRAKLPPTAPVENHKRIIRKRQSVTTETVLSRKYSTNVNILIVQIQIDPIKNII